jgi:MHS family alpha-ketoglutarate permease-like MFS transporter
MQAATAAASRRRLIQQGDLMHTMEFVPTMPGVPADAPARPTTLATPVKSERIELSRLRAILVGSIGNLVEWYDFYCFSAFSLYFASAFFPAQDPTAQMMSAAGIFALGFFVRPIGGILFGRIGDRLGRRSALMASVLLMCLGSLIIACAPTHAMVGVAAPAILLLARLLQGLSLGGEYGSSATYLSEMATSRHRGFYSSFQYVTLIGGQLLALAVLLLLQNVFLSPAELKQWGWRIPFFIGAGLRSWPCSCVATWQRRRRSKRCARAAPRWAACACWPSTRRR